MVEGRVKEKPQNRKGRVNLVVGVMVLALVFWGFFRYVLLPDSMPGTPQYVGSLQLVSLAQGDEALGQINQLHGTNIELENAFAAAYQPPYGGEYLMVWAGDAASDSVADALIIRMVDGIKLAKSGYTNPHQITVAGVGIWQADGSGGNFYFYKSSRQTNRVVWLTIQTKNIDAVLERALKTF